MAYSEYSTYAIFYELLKKRQIASGSSMYQTILQNPQIVSELEQMARDFECSIATGNHGIYLIPDLENNFLGLPRSGFTKLFGTDEGAKKANIGTFAILVLLLWFYDTEMKNRKTQPFLSLSVWMEELDAKLHEAAAQEEDEQGVFHDLLQVYSALISEESNSMKTKQGIFTKVRTFLVNQGLISYDESDEQIRTMPMLDDKVNFLLENKEYEALFDALKGGSHAKA